MPNAANISGLMITSSIWGDVAQDPVLQRLSKNNESLANRFSRSKPIIDALKSWLEAQLATVSGNSTIDCGEIRQPTRHAKTLVDWCDFFYKTYKDTPRDKLLEWMAGAPDIDRLRALPQEDLAIIICERWAYTKSQNP